MSGIELEKVVRSIVRKIRMEFANSDLEVDDLVSEGYLIAVEAMRKFDPSRNVKVSTYLYGEVYNRLRNYINRDVVPHMYGQEGFSRVPLDDAIGEPVKEQVSLETKIMLDTIADKLSGDDLVMFNMVRYGYTYQEVADELGVSKGTITNRFNKIKEKYGSE